MIVFPNMIIYLQTNLFCWKTHPQTVQQCHTLPFSQRAAGMEDHQPYQLL